MAALQQLPVGMEALYDRMALSITQQAPADQELASTILQYITCSMRILTISELSEALGDKISGMMDFQGSIVALCGGFVVIDNSGNVSMIHQTAREYLSGVGRPFCIDQEAAHEQVFLSCMRRLMTAGLRAKIKRNQGPEFLDYAATAWSLHLILAVGQDTSRVCEIIKKFLSGSWVLTWIEVLASTSQLRVLIRASSDLTEYAHKLKARSVEQDAEQQNTAELELLENWAIDLVKVAGRFGNTLRRNPDAIYKLIPPFCPKSSSIYRLFGKSEAKNLKVSGMGQTWDDCLARISFGALASSIATAGACIAVLAPSGSASVYDSSTFEETATSPIEHGERLYMFQLNSSGTLLATYGYRTTKIWETATGTCKLSLTNIESRPRPLAMLFSNDKLLVGTDDAHIRSIGMNHSQWQPVAHLDEPELEGHVLNCASYMALSRDGLAVVAYRGHPLSAWEIDGPVHIGHLWRKHNSNARGEIIAAVWLPHSPEVLGVYIEGTVFKWSPYDGEIEEVMVGAKRLAVSSDGDLFATGDGKGSVRVFTTSGFRLLYHLASQDTVFDLAFSPDLRRFYDIRGYYGNVWEPTALARFAAQSGNNESDAVTRTSSVNFRQIFDSITTLASSSNDRFYGCGTETGGVRIHRLQQDEPFHVHTSKGLLSIEQMSCSDDGRYICFSDTSRKITIKSVVLGADSTTETVAEIRMASIAKGGIMHLMFDSTSSSLLVQALSSLHIVSLTSFELTHSRGDAVERKWLRHPQDSSLILGFGVDDVQILDWDLNEQRTYKYGTTPRETEEVTKIDRVLDAYNKQHVLLQVSSKGMTKQLLYFDTASFSSSSEQGDEAKIAPTILTGKISSQISVALSILSRDRLIFLSKTQSICSWHLPSGPMKELIPLPGDWVNRDSLALSSIWGIEKSFLCPRNGEVAVVTCAALV